MDRVQYSGYVIDARTHQLADDNRWSLDISIEHHTDERVQVQTYGAVNTFETRDEAVQHCIDYGRKIIDGKVAGCTAP